LEIEDGAPEMDGAMSGFAWHRRVMHFVRLKRISSSNSPLVKLAVLIECGTHIIDLGAMKNEVRFPKMIDRYIFAIDKFEDSDFESQSVRQMMKHKMYHAQSRPVADATNEAEDSKDNKEDEAIARLFT
jgi:hypothetical protein